MGRYIYPPQRSARPSPKLPTALPTQEQIAEMRALPKGLGKTKKETADFWKVYDDYQTVDVVFAAGPLQLGQQVLDEDAEKVGLPKMVIPFNQVILVSDKGPQRFSPEAHANIPIAMKALKFVVETPLDQCLADKQPQLLELLAKKEATAKAEDDAAAAKKAQALQGSGSP